MLLSSLPGVAYLYCLAPTISSLANKYAGKVRVCKVNVDQVPAVAQRYRVMAIPTILIINNDEEVTRLVGLRPEGEYTTLLDRQIE